MNEKDFFVVDLDSGGVSKAKSIEDAITFIEEMLLDHPRKSLNDYCVFEGRRIMFQQKVIAE